MPVKSTGTTDDDGCRRMIFFGFDAHRSARARAASARRASTDMNGNAASGFARKMLPLSIETRTRPYERIGAGASVDRSTDRSIHSYWFPYDPVRVVDAVP